MVETVRIMKDIKFLPNTVDHHQSQYHWKLWLLVKDHKVKLKPISLMMCCNECRHNRIFKKIAKKPKKKN